MSSASCFTRGNSCVGWKREQNRRHKNAVLRTSIPADYGGIQLSDLELFPDRKKSRPPFHIVLVEPEIPPNTGNISRLCVGTGSVLHLVGKLGFSIDERAVKRAGLDYWKYLDLRRHEDLESLKKLHKGARLLYFSKTGRVPYTAAQYKDEDFLVFGSETRGLPKKVIEENRDSLYCIPTTQKVRSLNLSNACAVVIYEAIRQTRMEISGDGEIEKLREPGY